MGIDRRLGQACSVGLAPSGGQGVPAESPALGSHGAPRRARVGPALQTAADPLEGTRSDPVHGETRGPVGDGRRSRSSMSPAGAEIGSGQLSACPRKPAAHRGRDVTARAARRSGSCSRASTTCGGGPGLEGAMASAASWTGKIALTTEVDSPEATSPIASSRAARSSPVQCGELTAEKLRHHAPGAHRRSALGCLRSAETSLKPTSLPNGARSPNDGCANRSRRGRVSRRPAGGDLMRPRVRSAQP